MAEFDSPWKESLDVYFESFLQFCFPAIHPEIDWLRGYVPLDKELQKLSPKGDVLWVIERFNSLAVESIGVSSVTVSELWYGVCKSSKVEQNRGALVEFLLPLAVASYDDRAAVDYGEIRATLERAGKTIGPLDLMIAAHARSLNVTLVTNNVDEFRRVDGLVIENWAE